MKGCELMEDEENDPLVAVCRHLGDWRTAEYRLSALDDIRLDNISGGVRRRTPHPTVFAYVRCDAMESGDLAHSCLHGEGPHRIKVAIPKACNSRMVYKLLREIAEQRLNRTNCAARSDG